MTTGEFADIVQKMREAQKRYFKTHSREWLEKSKTLEKLDKNDIAALYRGGVKGTLRFKQYCKDVKEVQHGL